MKSHLGDIMGLTIESRLNNKQVLHNGTMGVYKDFTPVPNKELSVMQQFMKDVQTYLIAKTNHQIKLHTYGVEVQAGNNHSNSGKAFVGYDEGLDSKLRLCYCNDTFLAMEVVGHLQKYTTTKTPVNKVNVGNVKEVEQTPDNESVSQDFGWGDKGKKSILGTIDQSVNKLCNSYTKQEVLGDKDVKELGNNMKRLVKEYEGVLTVGGEFTPNNSSYQLIQSIIELVSTYVPYTKVRGYDYGLTWEMGNGEVVLHVQDREKGNEGITAMGLVVVKSGSPLYATLKKLIDFLSSNIGYKKIKRKALKAVSDRTGEESNKLDEVKVVKPVNKKPVNKKPVNKKPVNKKQAKEVSDNNVSKKETDLEDFGELDDQYYDIYLTHAGKWGNTDNRYEVLKSIIETIIREYGVDGLSLRGLDDTEVVIDWVINKQTHTMAITKKATRVGELEVMYDMAIAYDTDYPHILKELIQAKLDEVV